MSKGWVHHSTKPVRSRGCESFASTNDCTKLSFSDATTVRLVADWQLPSDTFDNFDQVTEYPQVSLHFRNTHKSFSKLDDWHMWRRARKLSKTENRVFELINRLKIILLAQPFCNRLACCLIFRHLLALSRQNHFCVLTKWFFVETYRTLSKFFVCDPGPEKHRSPALLVHWPSWKPVQLRPLKNYYVYAYYYKAMLIRSRQLKDCRWRFAPDTIL